MRPGRHYNRRLDDPTRISCLLCTPADQCSLSCLFEPDDGTVRNETSSIMSHNVLLKMLVIATVYLVLLLLCKGIETNSIRFNYGVFLLRISYINYLYIRGLDLVCKRMRPEKKIQNQFIFIFTNKRLQGF